jgi:acyl-coenzyme A synthetase/AMP-(fatty) acid ligase
MPASAEAGDQYILPVPILESGYPMVNIPTLTTKSAVEFVLKMAQKNVQEGRTNWMTNTVTHETLTFADVEPMSRKVASAMHKKGMVKGDIALYLTSDVTKIYTVILGVWRLGGCMYSSYPEDTQDTLLMRIKEGNAKYVFCDEISVPQVKVAIGQVGWNVEIIVFGESEGCSRVADLFEDAGDACPDPNSLNTEITDPILILCTSGTTGKSKGAVYTHRSVLGFCLGTGGIPRSDKPALLLLRCTHVLGILFPVRNICVAHWGIMMHQVTKENIFKAVDQYKPDFGFGFPTFLILLAIDPEAQKYDRSSLLSVCTGGMVINAQFYQAMMTLPNMKAVFNGYGMTEIGALTTTVDLSGTNGFRPLENIPHLSVGRLYPNTSLKVLDMDTGKPLGPNEKGELVVRSPIMCAGYWNRPEENASVFEDGWLKTGDLGYYDENGFVFVVDRLKETFKYYNNHISPAEIEEILVMHPAIREASVFGIPDPDGGDHIPRALIVLKPGKEVTTEEIRAFADERVAEYKKLRGGVYIVSALPRGKTGKIVRSMAATMPIPRVAF